jgi:hypothetical protein
MDTKLKKYNDWFDGLPQRTRQQLDRGEEIAIAMVDNARKATNYWAVWEALNDRLATGRRLPKVLQDWSAPGGTSEVRSSLVESTILATLRVSENPQNSDESLSACLLCGMLWDEKLVEILCTDEWIAGGVVEPTDFVINFERVRQPKSIDWFKENVPLGWGKNMSRPTNNSLVESRENLREVRNRIAHSLRGDFDRPTIDQIREAVALAVKISQEASLIFLGHTSGLETDLTDRKRKLDDVWHYFESGFVSAHDEWLDQKKRLEAES